MSVIKCVIAGEGAVGKSTLSQRMAGKHPGVNIQMTHGLDIQKMETDGLTVQLWDLGGQKRFRVFQADFLKGARIVLLVYSVEWFHSFLELDEWIELVVGPEIEVFLVANKVDVDRHAIGREMGRALADEHGFRFFGISALTGKGYDEFIAEFVRVARRVAGRRIEV